MTDTRLYLTIGIPSALFTLNFLGVLAAAFWQVKRFDDMRDMFRAENAALRSEFRGETAAIRSELQRVEGVLSAKIDALGFRVKALEDEMRTPLVKQ